MEPNEQGQNQPRQPEQNRQEQNRQDQPEGQQHSGSRGGNRNKNKFFHKRRPQRNDGQQQQQGPRTSFKKISVVIPLLDEEESLSTLANEIKRVLGAVNQNFEVLFVDDGSRDKSLAVLKELNRRDRRFRYISFQKNYGKSAALQVGFKNVTGDVVITMDADLQDDPNELPSLIQRLEEGYDLVSGWKKKRNDPFIKKYSSRFFNAVTRWSSGIKIHDFNCGLKAYRRPVTESIKVYGELHRYMPVLAHWQGFRVGESIVRHHARKFGKTKFGISRFFKGFVDLLTVVFITRYIKRPMHLFGFLGAIAFLAGLLVNGYLSYEWFMGKPLSNRPMLFLGILLIIVGVQFFSTGLIGELMVHNTQNDAEYRIKDKSSGGGHAPQQQQQ